MKPEIKNKIITIIVFVVVITITIFIIQLVGLGIDALRKKWNLNGVPEQTQTEKLSTTTSGTIIEQPSKLLSDFEKFNSYIKTSIYPNGIETPKSYINEGNKTLTDAGRKIIVTGQIDDAYVYIKAGANDQNGKFTSIIKSYDGVWFYLMNGQFLGGQLDLSRSIYGQPSELTELLYNLKSVPVAKNKEEYRKNNYQIKNLLTELKDERFVGALVSTQRYGKILELTIGYKCVEGSECKIELK